MITSLNWLKEYIDIDLSAEETGNLLTSLGLEVEGTEEIETIKGGLEGVVVGHVKECGKHPNADKLSLTKVDVGREELLQIVCGAPNVAAGQKVLVATIGTMLHPTEGEPFKIKKGKIRGEASEGMICAEDEIGIGTDHDGIIVLPEDTPVGMSGRDYYSIETDVVYDIGLTPNRSDATCHLGVAKDLAAALKIQHAGSGEVKVPTVDNFKIDNNELPVEVVVENTEACPRYAGVAIKGVTIKESPDWLKNRLLSIGVRPISNIVDITNFILHELGQPLHAFDLDEIAGQKVIVKTLPAESKFMSLDEVERTLSEEDLMICDGDSKGMCIGGVFGGIQSGVKDSTKNIFLESAHFNAKWIRRSSTRHDLRTDAAKVFEKGSDPNVCVYALKRAAALIVELAGGEVASDIVDIYPNPIEPVKIEVKYNYVNRLIGTDISPKEINDILLAMEMEIVSENEERFTVAVPTNKADVTRPADVVEEILRVYGLDNVPVPNQMRSSMIEREFPNPNEIKNAVSDYLAANGFHESMALSLSESKYYKEILPIDENELVWVNNTSNVHLDIMRPTMLFSGLEAVLHNQNRQRGDLKIFEFGKTYQRRTKDSGRQTGENGLDKIDVKRLFEEQDHLTLFMTGQQWGESWRNPGKPEADYYSLKAYVENVLARLGLSGYQQSAEQGGIFAYNMNYHRGPKSLVKFGKISPKTCKSMGIKSQVFYADFAWGALLKAAKKNSISMTELNKYPTMRRDLALVIGSSVKFADLAALAGKVGKKLIKDINLFDVYEDAEKLGEGKKSYAISFTFENAERTLKDKEVDKIMNELIRIYEQDMGAVIRR
ncbi:MAG: phenylalanine--tRNA ligase subunit beta [Bacteroidota bacterium]